MKTSGRVSERRMPRSPRKGLLSPSGVRPGIGLSPPASRVRMVTGRPVCPVDEPGVDLELGLLRHFLARPAENRNSVRVRPMPSQ
jgi:hypothetical protein